MLLTIIASFFSRQAPIQKKVAGSWIGHSLERAHVS